MAATKHSVFSAEQNALAKVAKALAHPARIAILQVLFEQKACVCNDLVLQLPLAQATISQHLKVLKEAELIQGEIAPNRSCYCINPQGWARAQSLLQAFLGTFNSPLEDKCC
jgi:ArsR family transcriptional regulator